MVVLLHIVEILVPLVVTIAAGYLLGKIFDLSEETLVRVLTDFVAPLLIFVSLYRSSLSGESVLRIGGASFFCHWIDRACCLCMGPTVETGSAVLPSSHPFL